MVSALTGALVGVSWLRRQRHVVAPEPLVILFLSVLAQLVVGTGEHQMAAALVSDAKSSCAGSQYSRSGRPACAGALL